MSRADLDLQRRRPQDAQMRLGDRPRASTFVPKFDGARNGRSAFKMKSVDFRLSNFGAKNGHQIKASCTARRSDPLQERNVVGAVGVRCCEYFAAPGKEVLLGR